MSVTIDPAAPRQAAELASVAVKAVIAPRCTAEAVKDAAAVIFPLLRLSKAKRTVLEDLILRIETLGAPKKTLRDLLKVLGDPDIPDNDVRVAAFEVLLKLK